MDDLVILKHAKSYIDQLAKGIDPLSGKKVPEQEVLSQERLLKCFAYVSTVLEGVVQEREPKDVKNVEASTETKEGDHTPEIKETTAQLPKTSEETTAPHENFQGELPISPEESPQSPQNMEKSPPQDRSPLPFHITAEQQVKVPISDDPVRLSNFCQTITDVVNHRNMLPLEKETVVNWLESQGYLTFPEDSEGIKPVASEKGRDIGIETIGGLLPFSSKTVTTYHTKAQHFILEHLWDILST